MKISRICACLLVLLTVVPLRAAALTPAEAHGIFAELRAACAEDGGQLWGFTLDGPVLLVDPASRGVVANVADAGGQLRAEDGVFVGTLPRELNLANTAVTWSGTRWAMVVLPLPKDVAARRTLLVHESWHREQDRLGVPLSQLDNGHLDTAAGRILLRLEMRALRAALLAQGEARRAAVQDALLFRAERRRQFPAAAAAEADLENNEGLAEYTGLKLSGRPDLAAQAAAILQQADGKSAFMRSFAYDTGPAYGLLLEEFRPAWRREVRAAMNLDALLREALRIELSAEIALAAERAALNYDGAALTTAENAHAARIAERTTAALQRFVHGPVLVLPLRQANTQFDPHTLYPLENHGTVYPTLRLVDVWGVLEVKSGGALIALAWDRAHVTAPMAAPSAGRVIETAEWRLELAPGWQIAPGARAGDLTLQPH